MKKITGVCQERDCNGPHYCKGYCKRHYNENYTSPIIDGQKRCCTCKEWLSIESFGGIKKLNADCKECHRQTNRRTVSSWTPEQRIRHAQKTEEGRIIRRNNNRRLTIEYLMDYPCEDCGETDPVVLEFDHIDPNNKTEAVCQLVASKVWSKVKAEIDKCEVRCANCHRRRTHNQFGWWGSEGVMPK